jgi:hypothetical protein
MKFIFLYALCLFSFIIKAQVPKKESIDPNIYNAYQSYEDSLKRLNQPKNVVKKTYNRQVITPSISIVARVDSNKVVLRWMPQSFETWQLGNKNGYDVFRVTSSKGDKKNQYDTLKLNKAPLVLLAESFWTDYGKVNKFAKVAGKLAY